MFLFFIIIIGELVKKSQTKKEKGLNLLTSIDSVYNIKQDSKNVIGFYKFFHTDSSMLNFFKAPFSFVA